MEDNELILDFFKKNSCIVIEMREWEKNISRVDEIYGILRLVSQKFDSIMITC